MFVTFFKKKKSQNSLILVSLLVYEGKLNIFKLWTNQDISRHCLGLSGAMMNTFTIF